MGFLRYYIKFKLKTLYPKHKIYVRQYKYSFGKKYRVITNAPIPESAFYNMFKKYKHLIELYVIPF